MLLLTSGPVLPVLEKRLASNSSAENKLQLLIPKGFAHGFSVISDVAEVLYKCDSYYNKSSEGSIIWNDAELGSTGKYLPVKRSFQRKTRSILHSKIAYIISFSVLNHRILVTGANGQLGMELRDLSLPHPEHMFIFLSREELAIENAEA
jgi:hypothetical protein